MARKRMFDLEIINQDSFFDLPMDAKALYFLLGMEADDEGFVAPKKILRLYGGSEDSIKLLIVKGFLISFPTGVVVITDWKRNNYLDKKRIKETIYINEKEQIYFNNSTEKYELKSIGLTNVKQMLNENRVEEISIEEYRVEENRVESVCNNTHACEETVECHLGSKFKNESCIRCMKKNKCPLIESSEFLLKHPKGFNDYDKKIEELYDTWAKERSEKGLDPVMSEFLQELEDYDWLNDSTHD